MNIIRGAYSLLSRHKDRINKFLPIFLASYMVLLILPYIFGWAPSINHFFSTGISQMLYRFITMIYGCVYLSLIGIVNRIKIKPPYIIGSVVLVVLVTISSIVSPHTIYYLDGSKMIDIKWWWYLFDIIKFIIALFLFVAISFFVHPVMKSHKTFNIAFYFLLGITSFACIYSLIFEFDSLAALFKGEDEHLVAIKSIFQNKNSYGLFLFISSLSAAYIIFTNNDDIRYSLLLIPLLVFTLFSILVGCRTAFISQVVLIGYLFIRSIIILKGHSNKAFYTIVGIASVFIILFILFLSIPAMHSGSLNGLYRVILYTFSEFGASLSSRMEIWKAVNNYMNGAYLFIGANFTNSQYLHRVYSPYRDFHSAYIKWFATSGIVGSLIYLALLAYIFYLVVKLIKKEPFQGVLLLIFLLSVMLYSLPESATIFISTSLYTFVTNLVIVVGVNYSLNRK